MQNKMLQFKQKMEKMLVTKTDKPFWKYKTNLLVIKQYVEECKKQEESYELVHMWDEVKTKFSSTRKWVVPNEIKDFAYIVAEIFEKNEQYQKALETLDILVFARTGYHYDEHMRHEDLKENLINEIDQQLFIKMKKIDYKAGNITEDEFGLEIEKTIEIYGPNGLEVNKNGMAYVLAPGEYLKMFFEEKNTIDDIINQIDDNDAILHPRTRLKFFEKNFNQGEYSIERVWIGKEKFSGYIAFSINGTDLIIIDKMFDIEEQEKIVYDFKEKTIITTEEKLGTVLSKVESDTMIEKNEEYYKNLIKKVNLNLSLGQKYLNLLDDPQGNDLEDITYEQPKRKSKKRKLIEEERQEIINNIKKLINERERRKKELKQVFFERGKWEEKRNKCLKETKQYL